MTEVKFNVLERIAILSESNKWTKELNIVSWDGREAKYEVRNWYKEDGRSGKGLTFTKDELKNLREVLNAIEI